MTTFDHASIWVLAAAVLLWVASMTGCQSTENAESMKRFMALEPVEVRAMHEGKVCKVTLRRGTVFIVHAERVKGEGRNTEQEKAIESPSKAVCVISCQQDTRK